MTRYWKITVVRGHCGHGVYDGLLTFYFEAANLLEATDRAMKMPGVKHSVLPRAACEIGLTEYLEGRKESAYCRDGMEQVSGKAQRRERLRGKNPKKR